MKRLAIALWLALTVVVRADITSNLDLKLGLNDGSGTTAADASGHGYNFTLVNSPTWQTSSPPEGSGYLTFASASTQYAWHNAAATIGRNTAGMSIAARLRWTDSSTIQVPVVISTASATQSRLVLEINPSGGAGKILISARDTDASTPQTVTTNGTFNDGTWHSIVGVVDITGDSILIYVDGSAVATTGTVAFAGSATSDTDSAKQFVGNYASGSFYYNGDMDDVRVWSRALSSDDVAEYGADTNQFTPTLGDNYANSIDNLLNPSPTGTNYKSIFSTFSPTDDTSVYNANGWGGGLPLIKSALTCVGWANTGTTAYGNGVAITKRHYLTTQHSNHNLVVGNTVTFIAADGTHIVRTVGGVSQFVGNPPGEALGYESFLVAYFTSDLPASITPCPIMADASSLTGIPLVKLDQEPNALVADFASTGDVYGNGARTITLAEPGDATRDVYYEGSVPGDSSSPIFAVVGSQVIYATGCITAGASSGPDVRTRTSAILQACRSLDTAATGYAPMFYRLLLLPHNARNSRSRR